jgi:hypothetical protein
MTRQRQFIQADFSEAGAAAGAISGFAKAVKTDAYLSDVIKYAHGELSRDFDLFMDGLFEGNHKMYHHVYEWNSDVGGDGDGGFFRLWRHTLIGGGAQRSASWEWVASKKPIPTLQERRLNEDDPASQLDDEQIDKFAKRRYLFYWKAPVMELGLPVNIEPKYGEFLAFPIWSLDGEDNIAFSRGLRSFEAGGEETTGAFTAAWAGWWATEAPQRFDEVVGKLLERDLKRDTESGIRTGTRARKGKVSLKAMTDYDVAFNRAQDWTEATIIRTSNTYKARERRRG